MAAWLTDYVFANSGSLHGCFIAGPAWQRSRSVTAVDVGDRTRKILLGCVLCPFKNLLA